MLYVQIIGRALRTAPGKEYALILDHSDTTAKLGFVTDIHHDTLDSGKAAIKAAPQERKEPLPKECEACAYLIPPRIPICPNCGHQRKPVCSIMEQDGELVEIIPGQLRKVGSKKEWSEQEKRVFIAELKGYALEHNYKSGWASMKFREKFGDFPPRHYDMIEPARALSPGVSLWIRSRNIAWHKSRAKQNAQVDDAQ
jgi:superfamily II DNA or RNA helicase